MWSWELNNLIKYYNEDYPGGNGPFVNDFGGGGDDKDDGKGDDGNGDGKDDKKYDKMKAIIKNIGILAVAALIFAGCYEDKGNYDYHDVNVMAALTFNPRPDRVEYDSVYYYSYPMSVEDTMYITYSPVLEQTQIADESQLEFQWVTLDPKNDDEPIDTVFTRDLTVGFPYQELVNYTVLFRLIDHSTGLEYYKELNLSTREAYQNCWYVLHGNAGDRRLGTAEVLPSFVRVLRRKLAQPFRHFR